MFYGMCFFLETSIVLRISFTRPLSTGKFFGSEAGFRISVNYSFTPKVENGFKSDDNVEILIHYKILLDKVFIANTSDQTWRFFKWREFCFFCMIEPELTLIFQRHWEKLLLLEKIEFRREKIVPKCGRSGYKNKTFTAARHYVQKQSKAGTMYKGSKALSTKAAKH